VSLVNGVGRQAPGEWIGLGVTLLVGGTVLSGDLVSAAKWWSDLEESVRTRARDSQGSSNATDATQVVGERFAEAFRLYREEVYERPLDEGEADRVEHLHLMDVRVVTPSGLVPSPDVMGLPLRISIDKIEGWTLGSLAQGAG
jgi:hypothetical protein